MGRGRIETKRTFYAEKKLWFDSFKFEKNNKKNNKNCLGEKMLKFMLLEYNCNLFGIVTFDVERYATSQLKKTKVIKRKTYRYIKSSDKIYILSF